MDGPFYLDYKTPFISADVAAVTLATTDKILYPVANFPLLPSGYFGFIGKKLRIRLFGRITTVATPGNGTFDVYWGNGTDANGTIIASSAALTLIANQTNLSWKLDLNIYCRALGVSGALFCDGDGYFNTAVMAAGDFLVPVSAPAQVTVDLTQSFNIGVNFKRSGSTAETMQVHDLDVIAYD